MKRISLDREFTFPRHILGTEGCGGPSFWTLETWRVYQELTAHVISHVLRSLLVESSCACVLYAVEGWVGAAVVTRRIRKGKDHSMSAGTVILLYVSLMDLEVEVCSSPQDMSDSNEFLNKSEENIHFIS